MKRLCLAILAVVMSMQTLTFAQLSTAVTHVLAGTPDANNPVGPLINRAINWVANKREWVWRQRPFSVNITQQNLTTATTGGWAYNPYNNANVTGPSAWDNSTGTGPGIYRDGQGTVWVYWPNHNLTPGFAFNMYGVTPATADNQPMNGGFIVTTTPDANTFTYTNPGPGISFVQDLNPTITGAFWINGQYALPADFASMKVLESAPQSFRRVTAVSLAEIYKYRQVGFALPYEIWYSCSYAPQTSSSTPPTPYIYLFPLPNMAVNGFLQGVYVRRMPTISNAGDVPDVPSHFLDLIYYAVRAFAKSTEEDQIGTDWAMVNSMMADFEAEDGIIQQPSGRMRQTVHVDDQMPLGPFYPQGNISGS